MDGSPVEEEEEEEEEEEAEEEEEEEEEEEDSFLRDNNVDLNDDTGGPAAIALDVSSLGVELDCSEAAEPALGMEFDTDEAAKEFYVAYANRVGFGVRMNKSRRSRRDDSVIMRRFVCTREGFHSKRVIYDDGKKKRKRGTTREGCKAMIEVIKKEHGKWAVSKLVADHTHPVLQPRRHPDKPLATGKLFDRANSSSSNNNNSNPFGEGGEAQSILQHLRRMQAENPAFFYAMQVDNNNCMTNLFWADAKARLAYRHFGDAVTFDTTYKKTKYMMPFAAFRGVNHHLQPVAFGCALLMDETKGSYVWLFETWLAAMGGRAPSSLTTDRDKAMEGAISRVFPGVRHYLCKWHVLSRSKQKLSDAYSKHAALKWELRRCVCETETVAEFEACWEAVLSKYSLWDNAWLQSLHEIRQRWVPVFLKTAFFPELCAGSGGRRRPESLKQFFKRNFNVKTPLLTFISRFEQAAASQYEKEVLAEFAAAYSRPALRTPSTIEKQAAEAYTAAVFAVFQEEFLQSLGYFAEKIEEEEGGRVSKFSVTREEDASKAYTVSLREPGQEVVCSCGKFESCGILCRHALRVYFVVGVRVLPERYILRRWTKDAVTMGGGGDAAEDAPDLAAWYNDLCRDAVRYGLEGAASVEMYRVAKAALQKAFAELSAAAKSLPRKAQQPSSLQRMRAQKLQHKMPLPKLPHCHEDAIEGKKRILPGNDVVAAHPTTAMPGNLPEC
ncbi:protein FAR1-RELATED SEQUENCE 9-like [Wolffia australiana]